MNAQNAKDFLPLVQALAEGKTIQVHVNGEWTDLLEPLFKSDPCVHRIKPIPRRYWIVLEPSGICNEAYTLKDVAELHCNRLTGSSVVEVTEVIR